MQLCFDIKALKVTTSCSYKQNKFNLLREQSEGYSKLTTELTSSLGPPHSSVTGLPTEPLPSIETRARATWERVVGLIGYFDLDPNRALDIVLDVFSVHIATHYAFFLAFLSISQWCSQSELAFVTQDEDAMVVEPDTRQYEEKSLDEILVLVEKQSYASCMRFTAPPSATRGSKTKVLAQVLGFKFSYYQVNTLNFSSS